MSVRVKRIQIENTLKEPRKRMHPQNKKFNKNINRKKNHQIETLEVKNMIK